MPTNIDLSESGLINAKEAADILGTTVGHVRRLTYMQLLQAYKLNGKFGFSLYRRSEVEQYRDTHPHLGSQLRST